MAVNNRSPLAYTGRVTAGTAKKGDVELDSTDFSITDQGKVSLSGTGALENLAADSGSVTPSGGSLTLAGGSGITSSGSGATITHALDADHIAYTEVTLTAAEIKALAATQKTLVAAQGAGTLIEFVSAQLKLNYGSEVFTESADNLVIKYTDDSGVAVSQVIECTGFIDQSADTYTNALPVADAIVAASAGENAALVLDNNGDGEFGGNASNDSTITVGIAYRVHAI